MQRSRAELEMMNLACSLEFVYYGHMSPAYLRFETINV